MCSLIFDYDSNPMISSDIYALPPVNISEEVKKAFEKPINEIYAKYCERINQAGGKILVHISKDGTKPLNHLLVCSDGDLCEEINAYLGSSPYI